MRYLKKAAALFLAAALTLSLCACAPLRCTTDPAGAAAPSATPEVSNEPTIVPAETARMGRLTVHMYDESKQYFSADGQALTLLYRCMTPVVTIEGRDAAAATLNAALSADADRFVQGTGAEGYDSLEEFIQGGQEFYDMLTGQGQTMDTPFAMERTVAVARGDSAVVSFRFDVYTNAGGAHGYTARSGLSFDVQTGQQLSLSDLSGDAAALTDFCAGYIVAASHDPKYPQEGFFEGYEDTLRSLVADGYWYMDEAGLVFVANPYDIAAYAAGRMEFTVPYADLANLLYPQYLPQSQSADGALEGALAEGTDGAARTAVVDDGTGGAGQAIDFTARGDVRNITLTRVQYMEYDNSFLTQETLWYGSLLQDGECLRVLTWIPDVMPNLQLSYVGADGVKQTVLLYQSGKDGSLLLLDAADFISLPMDITNSLPFSYDLNNDGVKETVELRPYQDELGNEYYELAVTSAGGQTVTQRSDVFYRPSIWAADVDGDGGVELYLSGDVGSDDYMTYGWRYDGGLQPISFSGDLRYNDGATQTYLDGRVAEIYGTNLLIESYVYMLGTYGATRLFAMEGGVVVPAAGSLWDFSGNEYWLELTAALPVTLDDGSESVLPVGAKLLLTGSDGCSAMKFMTDDYRLGTLSVAPNTAAGYGWLVSGMDENACFATLPYAG